VCTGLHISIVGAGHWTEVPLQDICWKRSKVVTFKNNTKLDSGITVPPRILRKAAEKVVTFKNNTKLDSGITVPPEILHKAAEKVVTFCERCSVTKKELFSRRWTGIQLYSYGHFAHPEEKVVTFRERCSLTKRELFSRRWTGIQPYASRDFALQEEKAVTFCERCSVTKRELFSRRWTGIQRYPDGYFEEKFVTFWERCSGTIRELFSRTVQQWTVQPQSVQQLSVLRLDQSPTPRDDRRHSLYSIRYEDGGPVHNMYLDLPAQPRALSHVNEHQMLQLHPYL